MDTNIAEKLLDELLPSLEAQEAQSAAILQFLKDKGVATDEQLAPYLEQAGNASNVRWRAARLRISRVLAISAEESSQAREQQPAHQETKSPEEVEPNDGQRAQGPKTADSEQEKTTAESEDGAKAESKEEKGAKPEGSDEKGNKSDSSEKKVTKAERSKDEGPKEEASKEVTPPKREQKDAA